MRATNLSGSTAVSLGDVYIGVVPLCRRGSGELSLDGDGEPVEWLEKMRRLPADRMLDRAIAAGTVSAEQVRQFSRVLAAFYRDAPLNRSNPRSIAHGC